jgi:hypothetical protein
MPERKPPAGWQAQPAAQEGVDGRVSSPTVDAVVPDDAERLAQVLLAHHEAAGQDADGAFEDAHVVVEREAIYTLAAQERGGEGDDGRVRGAQELPHDPAR